MPQPSKSEAVAFGIFLLMISTLLGKAYAVNAPPWLHYHRGLAEAVFAVFYFRVERDSLAREGEKRGAEEANTR